MNVGKWIVANLDFEVWPGFIVRWGGRNPWVPKVQVFFVGGWFWAGCDEIHDQNRKAKGERAKMSDGESKKGNPTDWITPAGRSEASQAGGELKMSAVILTLAEPLLKKPGMNVKRMESLIALTIAAWNKAMLPEGKQGSVEDEIINTLVPPGGSAETVAVIIEIMDLIEERRKELFPNLRMFVADHDFQASESGMTLNVGAAPIPAGR